jgi:D-sedoheptulose 7-phosphate isomerase
MVSDGAERVRALVLASIEAKQALLDSEELLEQIARVAALVSEALASGNRVLLFGNGGSAADAQHIAAELVGRFKLERAALAAEALTTNASVLTAVGNDYGFEEIFARLVQASGRPGDVAMGISTSGNSGNVVRGLETARRLGLRTVALTGADGGACAAAVEECVRVPSSDTARVQEAHILIGHMLCELVESKLAAGDA